MKHLFMLAILIVVSIAGCKKDENPTTPAPLEDLPNTPRKLLVDAPVGTVYNYISTASITDTNGVRTDVGGEKIPFTLLSTLQTDKEGNSYITYSSNEEDRAMVVNDTAMWFAKADLSKRYGFMLKTPFTKGTILDKNFSISAVNEEITVPYGRIKVITSTQIDTISTSPLYIKIETNSMTKGAIPFATMSRVKIKYTTTGKQTIETLRFELHSIVKP
jgi:hypothetical protein